MPNEWNVVVASSHMESSNALVSKLRRLSINVISCSGLKQTEEVLSQQAVNLVFCDETLADGSFRDLLARRKRKAPRVVVAIRTGEWNEYLEAMRMGAFDAIRCPLLPSDVETIVTRAMHEDQMKSDRMIA